MIPPSSSRTIFPLPIVTTSSSIATRASSGAGLAEFFLGVMGIGGVKGVLVEEEEEQEDVFEETEFDLLSLVLFPVLREQERNGDLGGLLPFNESNSLVLTRKGSLV